MFRIGGRRKGPPMETLAGRGGVEMAGIKKKKAGEGLGKT